MQNYTEIAGTDTLSVSRSALLNNDKTALSQSSGTAFPTTNLILGMPCYRSDQKKLYVLTDVTAQTWTVMGDLNRIPLFNGDVVGLYVDASGVYLATNATFNTTTSQWNRINTSLAASIMKLSLAGVATIYASSAGANPIASWDVINGGKVWNSFNSGPGSGMDADTVDGLQATQLLQTLVGTWQTSSDSKKRLKFTSNGETGFSSGDGTFKFYAADGSTALAALSAAGVLSSTGDVVANSGGTPVSLTAVASAIQASGGSFAVYPNAGTFTFTVPAGITKILAEVQAGGGGVGTSSTNGSDGGDTSVSKGSTVLISAQGGPKVWFTGSNGATQNGGAAATTTVGATLKSYGLPALNGAEVGTSSSSFTRDTRSPGMYGTNYVPSKLYNASGLLSTGWGAIRSNFANSGVVGSGGCWGSGYISVTPGDLLTITVGDGGISNSATWEASNGYVILRY